jgi:hypothetical protein
LAQPPSPSAERAAAPPRRRWIAKALLLLTSVIVTLTIAELVLRLFPGLGPRSGTLIPPAAPYPLTARTVIASPNYAGRLVGSDFQTGYRLNALGFRERELDIAEIAATRPYLFTGDSYFQGWGVEETARVSDVFARKLTGPDAPAVVNLAFPGFGTFQTLDVLDRYAAELHPRLVVHGLFIGNDIIEDFNTLSKEGATPTDTQTGYRVRARIRNALRNSSLVNLTLNVMWSVPWFHAEFDKLEIRSDRTELYTREESDVSRQMYAATASAIEQLGEFSRRSGIPVLVVIIPDHLQVLRPDLFLNLDASKPQRLIIQDLDRAGLQYLDLMDAFRHASDPGQLFFRKDKHWNERGHAFVAQILFDRLVSDPRSR